MSKTSSSSRPQPSKKLVAGGIVAGAAAGAWLTGKLRNSNTNLAPVEASPRQSSSFVDWEQARSIAVNMNRGAALTAPERAKLDALYRELSATCIPLVGSYMGVTLPPGVGTPAAFDRVDWINANIDAFRHMLTPLEPLLAGEGGNSSSRLSGVNRRIVAAELGILLGYLARRVLGQYDVALLGRERVEDGRLFYVEPNIQQVTANLNLPIDEFRTWLALHEMTHVFQFEAFPWVRPHFNDMLERYFRYLQEDARQLGESVKNLRVFLDRIRSQESSGSWLEALMNEEQRELFNEMQAMMSIIEGYSNHVMNAVGRDLLPNYESISKKFEVRQRNRSTAEQLFAKITGLDIKMEQYRQGQRFIDDVVRQRGHDTAMLVWAGPEYLPTLAEVKDPSAWLTRIDRAAEVSA